MVIGIGTRYSDFTTASKTQFAHPTVKFINLNIAEFDAHKHSGLPLTGDARESIQALGQTLAGWSVADAYRENAKALNEAWDKEVERMYNLGNEPLPSQAEVIGAVNGFADERDVILCAAGERSRRFAQAVAHS